MPYTTPTPDDVRADFPAFAEVPDLPIQRRIDRTAAVVDESWREDVYSYARSLLTAHYLAEDGFGEDAEVSGYAAMGVARIRSASLDVSFADGSASGGGLYDSTSYGRRFAALLRARSGPLITGNGGFCHAGAATDWPVAWRPGGWVF